MYFTKTHILKNKTQSMFFNKKQIKNTQKNNQKQISMHIFREIPKMYYINLKRSVKRNTQMKNQLEKYNFKYERFNAFDGRKKDVWEHLNLPLFSNYNYVKQTNLELACLLSHIYVIKKAYNDNQKYAIVLEDDVGLTFLNKHKKRFLNILNQYPKDYEIIQLTSSGKKVLENKKNKIFSKWNFKNWGTFAYLINRKGMEKIINMYSKMNYYNKTRHYVADYLLYINLKTYTLHIPFFNHYYNSSTINSHNFVNKNHNKIEELMEKKQREFEIKIYFFNTWKNKYLHI